MKVASVVQVDVGADCDDPGGEEVAPIAEDAPPEAPPEVAVVPPPRIFGGNESWPVLGGWIVYNRAGNSLDAHCPCDKHKDKHNPCR